MKAAALLLPLLAGVAFGQDAKGPYDAAMATIQQRIECADESADAANVKVWTGVIADRQAKTVTILACATGIKRTEPVEFYVAPVDSGKDYESLTVTPAKPSDVVAALQFVGFAPGLPIDANKNRFWARGPRLTLTFFNGNKSPLKSGDLLVDTTTGRSVPGTLLFAGSYTATDAQGHKHLAADEVDARPLAPDYEDPAAVLAVPRRAPQNTVYGFQKVSPAVDWKQGDAIDITLKEASGAEAVDTWPTKLRVSFDGGRSKFTLIDPYTTSGPIGPQPLDLPHLIGSLGRSRFIGADGKMVNLSRMTPEQLKLFQQAKIAPDGPPTDRYTTVTIDDNVPVTEARKLYGVLQALEKDAGVKLDAPPAGELYYRAFFPDPQWRDRSKRLGEPWELFLARDNAGKLAAKLEHLAEDPNAAADAPPVLTSTTPADPAAFVAAINAHPSKWSRAVFVYPPADLTYGELMAWVRPALATYPRIFVFPPQEAPPPGTTWPATQP